MDQFIVMNLNAIYEKNNSCEKKSLRENRLSQFDNVNTMIFIINCAMELDIELKDKKTLYGVYPTEGKKRLEKFLILIKLEKIN